MNRDFVPHLDYVFGFGLWYDIWIIIFSFVTSYLTIFVLFYYIVRFSFFSLHTKSLLLPYTYVSIEFIKLSSLAFNRILLTYSVNTSCFSLLNLCCDFNINSLFFMNLFWIACKTIFVKFIFFYLVYFIFKLSCF